MRSLSFALFSFLIALLYVIATPNISHAQTDEEIKQALIEQSLANYPGNCPCPYNIDRASRRCGKRSAYSKPGGYSPLCYAQDISKGMIESYKRRFLTKNKIVD